MADLLVRESAVPPRDAQALMREARRLRHRRWIGSASVLLIVTALVIVGLVVAGGSGAGAPRTPGSGGTGSVATSGQGSDREVARAAEALASIPSQVQVSLGEVACASPKYCMVLAGREPPSTSIGPRADTLAELWQGTSWRIVQVPLNPALLTGVSCPDVGWCMVVGSQYDPQITHRQDGFAEVFSDGHWTPLTLPPSDQGTPTSVSCTTTSFCVAVGTHDDRLGIESTFAERWDGSTWRTMRTPSSGENEFELSVSCASASSCMAVGYDGSTAEGPVAEHWNGRAWADLRVPHLGVRRTRCSDAMAFCPDFPDQPTLRQVSCGSPRFCLAVGTEPGHDLTEVWNGTAWHLAGRAARAVAVQDVACVQGARCVGIGSTPARFSAPPFLQWTGSRWRTIDRVRAGALGHGGYLDSISCTAPSRCVTVGQTDSTVDGTTTSVPMLAIWDGARWGVHQAGPVATPWPPARSDARDARVAAVAMLEGTILPPGSSPSATEPSGDGGRLHAASRTFDTPTVVDVRRFAVLPGSPASVLRWLSARPPSGSALATDEVAPPHELAFVWPTAGTLFDDQLVLADAVGLPGGRSALRLDAEVVWLPSKPSGDLVAGARVVDLERTLPGPGDVQRVTIRDPRIVATIEARLDLMAVAPPGRHACPRDTGPTITLMFARYAGAPPFATVVASGTGCRNVRVHRAGRWIAPELRGVTFVFFAGRAVGIGAR